MYFGAWFGTVPSAMRNTTAHVSVVAAIAHRRPRGLWVRRAVIFVSCALLVEALVGERGLAATRKARENSQRLSRRLTQLEIENAGLREQARRLHDDPAAIERAAREDLGLIKPGEVLVVVTDVNQGVRPPRLRRP